jgi:riboflavin synthase
MFTGIVQCMGPLTASDARGGDICLEIDINGLLTSGETALETGESVSVNGACLTVVACHEGCARFDVSRESLSVTLLGEFTVGQLLNLERSLQPISRLGGHFVSGHVDGIGELISCAQDARSWRMEFAAPTAIGIYIAPKGSITIDGVSLTVNSVTDGAQSCVFGVNIVPHTMAITTLGELVPGSRVHLEADLVARYLERLLAQRAPAVS